ncbi:MAG TPA: sigma-70 family RNA polymerase sigma factor [Vicinamibacterales bacterium]|nr:sigma-70 family RNA polymerase sigma factor [Vicinamibacterales bacterium]
MPKPSSEFPLPSISDVDRSLVSLFDECGASLHRYIGSLGVGAPDADDVVQDTFLSLFRHLQQGRPDTNLKGWLFTVAYRLALKHRVRATRRRNSLTTDLASAAEPIDARGTPEEIVQMTERQTKLLLALRALPERDRRCLYFRARGLRYREISALMGMSLGAVSNSLARSIRHLTNVDDASV